jgi:hypothetical protein
MNYDIFNGDADGLCALHQLRLSHPQESTLVTGVKRDIRLLERVPATTGLVTICDISLHENRTGLERLLAGGALVQYFDHHFAGELPEHANLRAFIDTSPTVCTSLIVDRFLSGQYRAWAVAAAFGDNLHESARNAARLLALDEDRLQQLRELGECLNYNAYGDTVEDLHFHPAELFRLMQPYSSPFDFISGETAFARLRAGYAEDMARASSLLPYFADAAHAVFVMPDEAWCRRVNGVFNNSLASSHAQRAHAIVTHKQPGVYAVSVRAPLANPQGADALCRQFETGGGRAGAAGINALPEADLERFVAGFCAAFPA